MPRDNVILTESILLIDCCKNHDDDENKSLKIYCGTKIKIEISKSWLFFQEIV